MVLHPSLSKVSWTSPPPCSMPTAQSVRREILPDHYARSRGGYSAFRRAPRPWEKLTLHHHQESEGDYWGSDASLNHFGPQTEQKQGEDENGSEDGDEDEEAADVEEHRVPKRVFPPAISSPATLRAESSLPQNLHSGVSLRAVREKGRLIITQQEARPAPRVFVARRENGGLRLQLLEEESHESGVPCKEEDPLERSILQEESHQQEAQQCAHDAQMLPPNEACIADSPTTSPLCGAVPIAKPTLQATSLGPDATQLTSASLINSPATTSAPSNASLDSILKTKFVRSHHRHHSVGSFLHESVIRVRPLVC